MDGPLSMLGPYAPSFAHRVASPELTFGEPRSGKPDDMMSWLTGLTMGAAGSFGVNVLRGSQAAFGGDYNGMIKYLAPKLLADGAKSYNIYQGGQPGSIPEAVQQAFGVRSQSIVRQQEGKSALYNRLQADKAARKPTIAEQLKAKQAKKVMGLRVPKGEQAVAREYEGAYQ